MASSRLEARFRVTSLEGLAEERERGRGCYGAVYEVRLHGMPCIAKRLHDILVGRGKEERVSREERRAVTGRFRKECELLSGLRHPNVVQFMGVHYGRDEADISLIMEYMHMDLDQCMKTYPNIPLPYKTSILRDVAYGLAYLHSIPIIHRDLNAGNVLLTESLKAKIADLGVAKLFDKRTPVNDLKQTITICPGAHHSMPPECLGPNPKYNDKLDVFSFGHLTICLVNQDEPDVDNSCITGEDIINKREHVSMRRTSLDKMGGPGHPLHSVAVQCLSDAPDQRPTSRDLVKRMEELCEKHPLPYENTLQLQNEEMTLKAKLAAKEHELAIRHTSQEQMIIERVEREVARRLKEANTCLEEKEKLMRVLEKKLIEKSQENSDLLNEKNCLERQHLKQMQAMADNSDNINEKQQKIDAMKQEIDAMKSKEKKKSRKRSQTVTGLAAAAIDKDHSREQLDACRRELDEEKNRSLQLQEQVDGLQKELEKLINENKQLEKRASNCQMQTNKAERFEQELKTLAAEKEELERVNAQLRSSIQDHYANTRQARHQFMNYPAYMLRQQQQACSHEERGGIMMQQQRHHTPLGHQLSAPPCYMNLGQQ